MDERGESGELNPEDRTYNPNEQNICKERKKPVLKHLEIRVHIFCNNKKIDRYIFLNIFLKGFNLKFDP